MGSATIAENPQRGGGPVRVECGAWTSIVEITVAQFGRKGQEMGGFGSTRWGWHRKKRTVEGCRKVNVRDLLDGKSPSPGRTVSLTWSDGASVRFTISDGFAVRLTYSITTPDGVKESFDYPIPLVAGRVPNGGEKWWFVCRISINRGLACGRRCGTLFLPPGQSCFGCRTCHRLTYRSCQTHDKRVSRLLKDPDALLSLSRHRRDLSIGELGLALTALQKFQEKLDQQIQKLPRPRSQPSTR